MDDDAADVHHDDAKDDAAETPSLVCRPSPGHVMLAERVRFAAHHRHDVETGSGDDDDV